MTKHATITARLMLCFSSRIWFNLDFVLQIFWALGTVFEVLLAILVMPTLGWRWLLGLSTIPLFIFAILCFVSMMLSVLKGSTTCKQSKLQLYHDMFFWGGGGGSSGYQRVLDTMCWQGTKKRLWPHWSALLQRTECPCHWENLSLPDR